MSDWPVNQVYRDSFAEKATLRLPPAYANKIGGNVVVQGDYVHAGVATDLSTRGAVIVFKVAQEP